MRATHRQSIRNGTHRGRRGVTLFELVVAMVLLGAVGSSFVPVLRRVEQMRRNIGRHELALQGFQNVLDEVASLPWDRVTQPEAEQVLKSEAERLDGAEWTVTVTNLDAELPARRITVAVTWPTPAGDRTTPVSLTTIVHQPGGSP